MLLNGDVGEMNKHVVQLAGAGGVLHRAEAAEPKLVPAGEFRAVQCSERRIKIAPCSQTRAVLFVSNF